MDKKLINQKILEETIPVGKISKAKREEMAYKLTDKNLIIENMSQSYRNIQHLKEEIQDQKIQKMNRSEKDTANYYPCEYDYVVKENNKYYIVYGWKQTMIELDFLKKQERTQILNDFEKNNKYRQRINRLPLTDFQLYMFKELLEVSLSTQVVEELQRLYRMKQIVPKLESNDNGYQKKIFEIFVSNPQKYTVRVDDLRADIITRAFCLDNNIDESIQRHPFTCELLFEYKNIHQYKNTLNFLSAKGYNLRQGDKENQRAQVLKILKQMYAEVYANNFQKISQYSAQSRCIKKHLSQYLTDEEKKKILNTICSKVKKKIIIIKMRFNIKIEIKIKSQSNQKYKSQSYSKTNSNQVSIKQSSHKCSQQYSPGAFKIPIVEAFDSEKDFLSEKKEKLQNLIQDTQAIFSFICQQQIQNKKFLKSSFCMNKVQQDCQMTAKQILDLNTKYFNLLQEKKDLTYDEEKEYSSYFDFRIINGFVKHLINSKLNIEDIPGLKLFK